MSVAATVTLPDEPATGRKAFVPLGGNGYTDPFAMYVIRNFLVTMDASGGVATIEVVMDDRFCSMVGYATYISSNGTIDPATVRWTLGSALAGSTPQMLRARQLPLNRSAVNVSVINDMWLPPAFLLPGADFSSLIVATDNDDTFTAQLFCVIYLYNINARQKVPYSHLVQARGGIGDGN